MSRMKSLLLVAAIAAPLAAFTFGGWAVTTVENVPEFAVAGKPFDLTYSVRQHGTTLLPGLWGKINISAGTTTRIFPTTEVGEGVYRSQVTLPAAGEWKVRIYNGFGDKSGTAFTVVARAATSATPSPMRPYDRGEQLFAAKGCANCHSHEMTKDLVATPIGPDLSEPKFANAYLTRFLTDPNIKKDWKGQWRMPNLGLKPAEVSALVAFLNQEKK